MCRRMEKLINGIMFHRGAKHMLHKPIFFIGAMNNLLYTWALTAAESTDTNVKKIKT